MTWNDITVKQFYELQKAGGLYEDELDKRLAIIAAIQGITFDEATDLKISEIAKLTKDYSFLNEPIKTKIVTKWRDYEFVIKLSNLKAGQMIDFLEACKEDINFKLHTVLAILDIGNKKDFDEKETEILNHCPIPIVKGISDFFFRRYELSPRVIQEYSLNRMKEMNQILRKQKQALEGIL
jgi:hypothetical protein